MFNPKQSMKYSSALFLLSATQPLSLVKSACLGTCAQVEANAACFDAFSEAFTGGGIVGTSLDTLVVYGRYCGNQNRCVAVEAITPGLEDWECLQGSANCPPPACDDIDAACLAQDLCLDQVAAPGSSDDLPARCPCDVTLVATNAQISGTATAPTGACDDAFYSTPLFDDVSFPTLPEGEPTIPSPAIPAAIDAIGHEANLLAVGFCCNVLSSECQADSIAQNYASTYNLAVTYCNQLLQALSPPGGSLCVTTPPIGGGGEICYICGGNENQRVTNPDQGLPQNIGLPQEVAELSCGKAEMDGLAGGLSSLSCAALQIGAFLVRSACGCQGVTFPTTTIASTAATPPAASPSLPDVTSPPTLLRTTPAPTGSHDVCYVCGSADRVMTNPQAQLPQSIFTCGDVEQAGLRRTIRAEQCQSIREAAAIFDSTCGCAMKTLAPTPVPTIFVSSPPTITTTTTSPVMSPTTTTTTSPVGLPTSAAPSSWLGRQSRGTRMLGSAVVGMLVLAPLAL